MYRNEAVMPGRTCEAAGTGEQPPAPRDGSAPSGGTGSRDGSALSGGPKVMGRECGGAWVVVARGAYDMQSITPLANALGAAAARGQKVVLDASGITFADSSLLNLLVRTHLATTLRVTSPPRQLRRLLEITGTDTVLEVRATVEDALAS
nr:STAS domain-containing protein [Streptomyces sp. Xyl84]